MERLLEHAEPGEEQLLGLLGVPGLRLVGRLDPQVEGLLEVGRDVAGRDGLLAEIWPGELVVRGGRVGLLRPAAGGLPCLESLAGVDERLVLPVGRRGLLPDALGRRCRAGRRRRDVPARSAGDAPDGPTAMDRTKVRRFMAESGWLKPLMN